MYQQKMCANFTSSHVLKKRKLLNDLSLKYIEIDVIVCCRSDYFFAAHTPFQRNCHSNTPHTHSFIHLQV